MDNLSGNLRISSDAVIADFVDKQNSFLPSQFFPLVYIVTSLGRCSQLNYKLLNPTKLVIHILSFILSVLLIVSAFFFPGFFSHKRSDHYLSLFYHFWTNVCFSYSRIILTVGQDWFSVSMIFKTLILFTWYSLYSCQLCSVKIKEHKTKKV